MVFFNVNDDPFVIYKKCLKAIGIWPQDRYKWGSTIIFSITLLLLTATIIIRLVDPHGKCPPNDLRDREFMVTAFLVMALGMQLSRRVYGSRMVSLIESTIEDWSSIVDPQEREIMERHNRSGKYIWTAQIAYLFLPQIIMNFISLPFYKNVETSERYADRQICAFNDDSTWIIALGVFLTTTASIIGTMSCCGGNLIFWSFAMHLSSQYKILKSRFQKCFIIWDENERHQKFRRLVDRHNRLLDLCTDLDDSFTVFAAIQVFGCQCSVCLTAMQLVAVMKAGEYILMPVLILNTALILLVPFLYCYAGEHLSVSCEEIFQKFTQCKWYCHSKDSVINYRIVIARSQYPKTLTVMKFYNLNLSNFKTIFHAVYSYISLLTAITTDKK